MKSIIFATILAGIVAIYLPVTALAKCKIVSSYTYVIIDGVAYADTDSDGIRNCTDETDADGDGMGDGFPVDNCVSVPNGDCDKDPLNCDINGDKTASQTELLAGDQADWDHDGVGNACDDTDNDGVMDYADNCKTVSNSSQNATACTDTDYDSFEDPIDNCIKDYNPNQTNSDSDKYGDACDNCPFVANDDQNTSACAEAQTQSALRGSSPTPSQSTTTVDVPYHEEGGGGCTITSRSELTTLTAVMIFIAAPILLAIRRKV